MRGKFQEELLSELGTPKVKFLWLNYCRIMLLRLDVLVPFAAAKKLQDKF